MSLDNLPVEVLFIITDLLDYDDLYSVTYTCKSLNMLLTFEQVCRKVIQTQFSYTKEARQAREQHISYQKALSIIHNRRSAFQGAHPFSARIVGQGNDFCYRHRILCTLEENIIRVSDTCAKSEVKIDLSTVIEPFLGSLESSTLSFLYYNEDIVTVYYNQPNNDRILVINTAYNHPDSTRLLREIQLESTHRLFARHTSKYLYYGTHTSVGSTGANEWEIQGISLDDSRNLSSDPLQLHDFFGSDIGSTVAFEICRGQFYAVSNQTTLAVEEISWTSFYHCIRFPLDDPTPAALQSNNKVWRRQDSEGIIDDNWTDLTIQFETTENVIIVETRREHQSSQGWLRTVYISKFNSEILETSTEPMLLPDDALVSALDPTDNPQYAPSQPRYNWNFHPHVPSTARTFIRSRTVFQAYDYPCSSFFDLVIDDHCCGSDSSAPCLRIRIGSRRIGPLDWKQLEPTQLLRPPAFGDDVAYRHSQVKLWPPASRCPCSERLHHILTPIPPSGPNLTWSIMGVLDESSFVYMIRPGRSFNQTGNKTIGSIVMVSFDRSPLNDESFDYEECSEEWYWQPGVCKNDGCR